MMKGKAPAKHTTLKPANKFSNNTSDDDYMGSDTSDRGNKVIQVKSRPVDKELVKCANCKKDRSQCLINPSMVGKASPACMSASWQSESAPFTRGHQPKAEGRGQLEQ